MSPGSQRWVCAGSCVMDFSSWDPESVTPHEVEACDTSLRLRSRFSQLHLLRMVKEHEVPVQAPLHTSRLEAGTRPRFPSHLRLRQQRQAGVWELQSLEERKRRRGRGGGASLSRDLLSHCSHNLL